MYWGTGPTACQGRINTGRLTLVECPLTLIGRFDPPVGDLISLIGTGGSLRAITVTLDRLTLTFLDDPVSLI